MSDILTFTGAVSHDAAIEVWFARQTDVMRALATPWFDRMRACGSDVRELMHDGFATACVHDVPFAYVGIYTTHVNVGFFSGVQLSDPVGLLQGTGKRMRHAKLRPGVSVDQPALATLIMAAYHEARAQRAGRLHA